MTYTVVTQTGKEIIIHDAGEKEGVTIRIKEK